MKVSHLKRKLKIFYTIFIAAQKNWRLPKHSEVLIYDACGQEELAPYLTKYQVSTLAVRGESINVPCLLLAMLKPEFWKGKLLCAYAEAFIQAVFPKVVITFIDNNPNFYNLSKRFPVIKTIFVQNGSRGETGDVFDSLVKSDSHHVDYMCVFGAAIGRHYLKYLSGKSVPIGSLKNNAVDKSDKPTDDEVLFISQWHSKPNNGVFFHVENDGTQIYWEAFYEAEVKVLGFLNKWCAENNKLLKICGRETDKDGPEKKFYAELLTKCKWEYIPRTEIYSSYKLINATNIVIFIDSTLGYESIARGKRTASFSCRMFGAQRQFYVFGWPADLSNNGPFWTNNQDETQFQRIMDYLNTVSDEEWEQTRQQYASELMDFDPGNTRLIALLDKLLPNSSSASQPACRKPIWN